MASAYDRVAETMRADILSGRFPSGERLPDEAALAERYEVGRSTIREALRLLSGRGWLRSVRGARGGIFVARPRPFEVGHQLGDDLVFLVGSGGISITEVVEARHLYEEASARLAALRAGPAEVERITSLADKGRQLIDDPQAFTETSGRFHIAVTEAAHNQVLLVWVGAMHRVLLEVINKASGGRDGRAHVAKQHADIATAIALGDQEAAAAAMTEHLRDSARDYARNSSVE